MARKLSRFLILGAVLISGLATPAVWGQDEVDGGEARGSFANAQRVMGTVTVVAPNMLTVKTEKGETFQISTTANTRLMKERQPVQFGIIHSGDSVGAMGILDESTKTLHAMVVMIVDAEQVKKAREGLGKIYIAGRVTAMDELKITVLRPDGVSQVIEVDEGTSFKRGGRGLSGISGFGAFGGGAPGSGMGNSEASKARGGAAAGSGGESITLADVKVGDSVGGPGAVKHGVFVPTELNVAVPGAGRRHRSAEGAGAGMGAGAGDASGAGSTANSK